MKKTSTIFIFFMIVLVGGVMAETTMNTLTKGHADTLYCPFGGCNFTSTISAEDFILHNGSSCCGGGGGGSGDITEVNTAGKYLSGGAASGAVNLLFSEAELNITTNASIDVRVDVSFLRNILDSIYATISDVQNWINSNSTADRAYTDTRVDSINNLSNSSILDLTSIYNDTNSILWENLTGQAELKTPQDINLQENNINNVSNITVKKIFSGFYDWIIQAGDSRRYLEFNGTDLLINESEINKTIDARTATITYNATTIETRAGTPEGDVESIKGIKDGNVYNVTEAAGANPLIIVVNFTGVVSFSEIVMREKYSATSGHNIKIGIETCATGEYEEEFQPDITGMDNFAIRVETVVDPLNHLCGGNVSIRLRHDENGNPSHIFSLDFLVIQSGPTTMVSEEVDPLAFHRSGDVVMQGNANFGGFNITNAGLSADDVLQAINNQNVTFENINKTGIMYPNEKGLSCDNLIGYWNGNVLASDFSGQGNDCSVNGGVITNENGRFGSTFEFDGKSGSFLNCGGTGAVNVDYVNFTIGAWIYLNKTSGNFKYVFVQEHPDRGGSLELAVTNQNKPSFFVANYTPDESWTPDATALGDIVLSNKTWYHLVGRRNQTHISLYLNGLQVALATADPNINISSEGQPLTISGNPDSGNPFPGFIDEAFLYNRSLSSEEIKSLYERNKEIDCSSGYILKSDTSILNTSTDSRVTQSFLENLGFNITSDIKIWTQNFVDIFVDNDSVLRNDSHADLDFLLVDNIQLDDKTISSINSQDLTISTPAARSLILSPGNILSLLPTTKTSTNKPFTTTSTISTGALTIESSTIKTSSGNKLLLEPNVTTESSRGIVVTSTGYFATQSLNITGNTITTISPVTSIQLGSNTGLSTGGTIEAQTLKAEVLDMGSATINDFTTNLIRAQNVFIQLADPLFTNSNITTTQGFQAKDGVFTNTLFVQNEMISGSPVKFPEGIRIIGKPNGTEVTNPVFDGTGLDDFEMFGKYTGTHNRDYVVKIDGTSPDTYKWSNDSGVSFQDTGINVNSTFQLLDNGLSIRWDAESGHTMNDNWSFNAQFKLTPVLLNLTDENGSTMFSVTSQGKISYSDNIGIGSVSGGTISIGQGANASGINSISVGENSLSSAENSLSWGKEANASRTRAIAFGFNSTATAEGCIAFGSGTVCDEVNEVNLGGYTLIAEGIEATISSTVARLNVTINLTLANSGGIWGNGSGICIGAC